MPNFGEFIFGTSPKNKQLSTLIPEQTSALQNFFSDNVNQSPLYGAGQNYLQSLLSGSPESRADFEAPYMQQFKQQILPALGERFAGMGTGAGALNSSAFNQAATQAGTGLQGYLAQLRQQLMMQALPQAAQYSQMPYSNLFNALNIHPFENVHTPSSTGLFHSLAQGLGSSIGNMGTGGF
jgi:hypothetical protein